MLMQWYNFGYENKVQRTHPCHGSCGAILNLGDREVRVRFPDSKTSRGMHIKCFIQLLTDDLKMIKEYRY